MQVDTREIAAMVIDAIGDGTSWPHHTHNPLVNWIVDCITSGELELYEEEILMKEIRAVDERQL